MIDVWSDPDYFFAESKPETLLLAALDYSLEKIIVYAAPKRRGSILFRTIAGRLGRRIVYVPLGTLNRATVKKLRTMHVLIERSATSPATTFGDGALEAQRR
ncbi:MAG: hypothetical protein R2748_14630 [Bryobacterales bacterium]